MNGMILLAAALSAGLPKLELMDARTADRAGGLSDRADI